MNQKMKTKAPTTPTPTPAITPLNFTPLLRVMFDMAGIACPKADAYEAHVVAQEESDAPL